MSILNNHISIITFLRPGIIKAEKNDGNKEEFFVEDGTVEFFNNNLIILSISAKNVKNLKKDFLDSLSKDAQKQLTEKNISDRHDEITTKIYLLTSLLLHHIKPPLLANYRF